MRRSEGGRRTMGDIKKLMTKQRKKDIKTKSAVGSSTVFQEAAAASPEGLVGEAARG
jgi:hypothetical protein